MDKTPAVFLLHIRDAIYLIEEYVANYSFDQFVYDTKTQDAVIRQLEIIGEATRNLEEDFKKENDDIPWQQISDFRNVLAHEYWDIDLEIIWKALQEDIVALKTSILPLLSTNTPG